MKKFISSLGLDNLPIPAIPSPFASPAPSRPSTPPSSSPNSLPPLITNNLNAANAATDPKTAEAAAAPISAKKDLKNTRDWECPLSPFTQQQSSPRPLPFREHSSSSIITIKTPTPGGIRSRSRGPPANWSAKRGGSGGAGVGSGGVSPPVPAIKVSGVGIGLACGVPGLSGVTESDIYRYRRQRGVCLPEWLRKDEDLWKSLDAAGSLVTAVKVQVGWWAFEAGDASTGPGNSKRAAFEELNETIKKAEDHGKGVLLALTHPPQAQLVCATKPSRVPQRLFDEVLRRHGNIVGIEVWPPGRVHEWEWMERWFEGVFGLLEQLEGASEVGEVPLYIPVQCGDVKKWVEWVRSREGYPVVLDVLWDGNWELGRGLEGVDWVVTPRGCKRGVVWRENVVEGREGTEVKGYAGWFGRWERPTINQPPTPPRTSVDMDPNFLSPLMSMASIELHRTAISRKPAVKRAAVEDFLRMQQDREPVLTSPNGKGSADTGLKYLSPVAARHFEAGFDTGFSDAQAFALGGLGAW
ncbi:hypothetical protein BDZ91DRAFT_327304 [Kalaharituber pfeilii]|nr:hypothetical protein BDZ91DRAFT_327304 [Kalaharituber pfeilii]